MSNLFERKDKIIDSTSTRGLLFTSLCLMANKSGFESGTNFRTFRAKSSGKLPEID